MYCCQIHKITNDSHELLHSLTMENEDTPEEKVSKLSIENNAANERDDGTAVAGNKPDDVRSDLNFEVLDELNSAKIQKPQPLYQIRPPLHEKFRPLSAKEVIHNVLFDQLSTKTYDAKEASQWTKDIANIIRVKVKELQFKRYKYVVNVVLGEHHGAGVKIGTRCIWDAEADSYAHDNFLNETIFCVATVYAVYLY